MAGGGRVFKFHQAHQGLFLALVGTRKALVLTSPSDFLPFWPTQIFFSYFWEFPGISEIFGEFPKNFGNSWGNFMESPFTLTKNNFFKNLKPGFQISLCKPRTLALDQENCCVSEKKSGLLCNNEISIFNRDR